MSLCYKYKVYIFSILIAISVGLLSGFVATNSVIVFDMLEKPPLTPPASFFPVVWVVLYILMGISAAIIYLSCSIKKRCALLIYGVQLIVNFWWSIIFFRFNLYLFAFLWILLLIGIIKIMIFNFYKINKYAAFLQMPYLLWVTFAGYINLMIYILNR